MMMMIVMMTTMRGRRRTQRAKNVQILLLYSETFATAQREKERERFHTTTAFISYVWPVLGSAAKIASPVSTSSCSFAATCAGSISPTGTMCFRAPQPESNEREREREREREGDDVSEVQCVSGCERWLRGSRRSETHSCAQRWPALRQRMRASAAANPGSAFASHCSCPRGTRCVCVCVC